MPYAVVMMTNVLDNDHPPTGVPHANAETPEQKFTVVRPTPDTHVVYETRIMAKSDKFGSDIALANRLGVPLRIAGCSGFHAPYYNKVTAVLGVVVDPTDPLFGEFVASRWRPIITNETVVLFRKDGEDFDEKQAEALHEYCSTQLQPLYVEIATMRNEGEDIRGLVAQVLEKMTPEAYAKFWEEYRDEQMKVLTNGDWAELKCPVQLEKDYRAKNCGACGGKDGKGGSALLQCAKCRKVKYYSKECQKKDWNDHKITCKAA